MGLTSLLRRFSRRSRFYTIELVPVVGVAAGSPFRQSDAESRTRRQESIVVSLEELAAALRAGDIRFRRRGSRKLLVEGQRSDRAVIVRVANPDRVSFETMRLCYCEDWPTAIAVVHALTSVLGPVTAQLQAITLLFDPQCSVAQLCGDYRDALHADLDNAMRRMDDMGSFLNQVSEQLSNKQRNRD